MLRVLPSTAGCVRNMLWHCYALGMVVLGAVPLIASQAMWLSPDTSPATSGLNCGCYTATQRPVHMLLLRQCQGSVDAPNVVVPRGVGGGHMLVLKQSSSDHLDAGYQRDPCTCKNSAMYVL